MGVGGLRESRPARFGPLTGRCLVPAEDNGVGDPEWRIADPRHGNSGLKIRLSGHCGERFALTTQWLQDPRHANTVATGSVHTKHAGTSAPPARTCRHRREGRGGGGNLADRAKQAVAGLAIERQVARRTPTTAACARRGRPQRCRSCLPWWRRSTVAGMVGEQRSSGAPWVRIPLAPTCRAGAFSRWVRILRLASFRMRICGPSTLTRRIFRPPFAGRGSATRHSGSATPPTPSGRVRHTQ